MMDEAKYHKGETVSFEGEEYICLGDEEYTCREKVANRRLETKLWVSFSAMVLVAVFGLLFMMDNSTGEVCYALMQFATVMVHGYYVVTGHKQDIKLDWDMEVNFYSEHHWGCFVLEIFPTLTFERVDHYTHRHYYVSIGWLCWSIMFDWMKKR